MGQRKDRHSLLCNGHIGIMTVLRSMCMWVGVCVCVRPCFFFPPPSVIFFCNISFTLKACCLKSRLFGLYTLNIIAILYPVFGQLQWNTTGWSAGPATNGKIVYVCERVCVRVVMDSTGWCRSGIWICAGLSLVIPRCASVTPCPWELTYDPPPDSCESSAGLVESKTMGSPVVMQRHGAHTNKHTYSRTICCLVYPTPFVAPPPQWKEQNWRGGGEGDQGKGQQSGHPGRFSGMSAPHAFSPEATSATFDR